MFAVKQTPSGTADNPTSTGSYIHYIFKYSTGIHILSYSSANSELSHTLTFNGGSTWYGWYEISDTNRIPAGITFKRYSTAASSETVTFSQVMNRSAFILFITENGVGCTIYACAKGSTEWLFEKLVGKTKTFTTDGNSFSFSMSNYSSATIIGDFN